MHAYGTARMNGATPSRRGGTERKRQFFWLLLYVRATHSSGLPWCHTEWVPYNKIIITIVEHNTWETSLVHCISIATRALNSNNTWQ